VAGWHDGFMSNALLDPEVCYRALLTRDARFDGRFFTAVRTTGIYCRPICPATTPKAAHVTFYRSAAAAEAAGFRSCLRCRPERAPETTATGSSSRIVEQAMILIAEGEAGEEGSLAKKLGVGERQLRRLFQSQLGASPKALAQTRRNLLARQLVVETDLPLTEVALAAGFGSLRRFNTVFRDLYGRPPSAMRRASAKSMEAGLVLTLPFRPPYDWPGMVALLAAHATPGVEQVSTDRYARLIAMDGKHGSVEVWLAGPDSLRAKIDFPDIRLLPRIVARLRRLFDLGADPAAIDAWLGRDPALAGLVRHRPGLRVPGAWDPFELAVRVILGQQVSVAAGSRMAGKLVAAFGAPVAPRDPNLFALFPTAAVLAAVAPDAVSLALNMPRARGAAIVNLARAVTETPGLLTRGEGLDIAQRRLCAVNGIGPWTAQCIALFALRETDAFPTGDVGLQRALGLPAAALAARAEQWRPWRAYAATHLWMVALGLSPAPERTLDENAVA
jgi:AraC family transcriptional regulator of adaptative response / DNA-3-methyladenine glycosylase II